MLVVESAASLVAQLAKSLPAKQETPVPFLGWKICWRRDRLPTPVFLGFLGSPCAPPAEQGWEHVALG